MWVLMLAVALAVCVTLGFAFLGGNTSDRPIAEVNGVKQVSAVKDARLAVYDGTGWRAQFWNGVNLGASLPGHSPGELVPTKQDYLRWFPQMKEMNVDVVRVYTILEPEFYEALDEFNAGREDPLWLIHGVWSPEEELIGEDQRGRDAYTPEITREFEEEISDAVAVVHGDANLPERTGHASGRFRTDVSQYMLGWMIGTEWFPFAVQATNVANRGMEPYSGRYFRATPEATPFESWLTRMMDRLAEQEMEYGWQHPISFTNWLTTDPLDHPNESNEQEDLAPVDPMHAEPTSGWTAGYFSQYHVYPYYPDFLRYEVEYQNYRGADGEIDPYAGYLNELRAHHDGIPLMVGEFGLPTSRGMAHRGPLGRDQGYHTEERQGELIAGMQEAMRSEGLDGALLFAWADEWFKFTWNTVELELPGERRDRWRNRLTNEEHFGVIATEAGTENGQIFVDGDNGDWEDREKGLVGRVSGMFSKQDTRVTRREYEEFSLRATHDEAHLYLLLKKREGAWDLGEDPVSIGFGTLQDGSPEAKPAPDLVYPGGGIQFLLQMNGSDDSRILVNSAYDQHTWLWASKWNMIPEPDASRQASAGDFLPWKLPLSRKIFLPQTRERIPFDEIEVGVMREGTSDPSSPAFNNLSDWYAEGDVLEIRIPWMLLGFTDPSSHKVWDYPYEADAIEPVETEEIRIYPAVTSRGENQREVIPLFYTWSDWEEPAFHERKKKSFEILKQAYAEGKQLQEPPTAAANAGAGT